MAEGYFVAVQTLRSPDSQRLHELARRGEFFWLDLQDPDRATLEEVAQTLSIHPLALEDTQEFCQRPKVDVYGDQLLLVYYGARLDEDGLPEPVEVHLHLSGSHVVSVHRESCEQFDRVRDALARHQPGSEDQVAYRIVDALTDSIIATLDHVADRIDAFETEVFRRPRARDRDRMAAMRRALGALRRMLTVQRQVFSRLVDHVCALPGLEHGLRVYYRDVEDHLARAQDEVEQARDDLQGMLDTYTNEVQERLTIVATIFLPLTMLTGFFGMNFTFMINHIGSAGTFFGLGLGGLLVAALAIYVWLVRSGLLNRRGR